MSGMPVDSRQADNERGAQFDSDRGLQIDNDSRKDAGLSQQHTGSSSSTNRSVESTHTRKMLLH